MAEEKEGRVKMWDAVPGYDFNEEADLADLDSWFFDGTHSVPALTPMYSWFWIRYVTYGSQYSAETLSLPRYKGFTGRIRDGGTYAGMRIVKDEAEVEERTKKFREALIPWIEDFDGIWDGYKDELLNMYEKLKAVDLEKATSIELMHHLWDMISILE